MVDDFPFPEQDSDSLSKRKLPLKWDEGYKKTYPETRKKGKSTMIMSQKNSGLEDAVLEDAFSEF